MKGLVGRGGQEVWLGWLFDKIGLGAMLRGLLSKAGKEGWYEGAVSRVGLAWLFSKVGQDGRLEGLVKRVDSRVG